MLANGRMRGHGLVDDGLRERRLVAFVVAVAAVADEIDQEIEAEARAILPRQPGGLEARDRVVGVDVHDRDLEPAGEAARVAGAVRLLGRGGEPELVVRDDVDRPAGVVAGQPRQVQRFGHHALAGKRRVAVDEDRQRDPAVEARRAPAVGHRAGGPRHPDHHGIDGFEMAGIRRQRDVHLPARRGRARARVVLDVTGPAQVGAIRGGRDRILELGEDLRVRLVEHVGQDVEPPAVRHAEQREPRAPARRPADDLVEDRHEHVEPLDREARLAGKRAVQKALERLDLAQPIEHGGRRGGVHRREEAAGLGSVAEPVALLRHEHVRVVESGRRTVDAAQPFDRLEGARSRLGNRSLHERGRQALEILVGDAVSRGRQRRIADRIRAERVDAGREVAVPPDAVREVRGADNLGDVVADVRPGVPRAGHRHGCRRRAGRRRRPGFERPPGVGIDGAGILPEAFV